MVSSTIGFCIAWYIKNKELELEKKAMENQKQGENQLGDRFETIASNVLRKHSEDFLKDFEQARKQHDMTLENKEKDFSKIAENVEKTVGEVKNKITEFEKQRDQQIGALGESIKNVLDTGVKMHQSALSLKAVLSSASAVRGRWGEAVLKNLLEESGLQEGIDFEIQQTISGEESASLRPDVIINLPGKLRLAIDSKAGLEEFFKACEEKEDDKKREHIQKFAMNLRAHIKDLSSKEYQKHLDGRIPYVIMFVPGEAAVRAVFEQDINLYREAQEKRVMLASPATIMPLVLLIAHAWRQHKSVENAAKLAEEVVDLGSRIKVFATHVMGIGNYISQATKKFNQAAGSWDTKIAPKIEKINALGGNLQIETQQVQTIEEEPRVANKLLEEVTAFTEKNSLNEELHEEANKRVKRP